MAISGQELFVKKADMQDRKQNVGSLEWIILWKYNTAFHLIIAVCEGIFKCGCVRVHTLTYKCAYTSTYIIHF